MSSRTIRKAATKRVSAAAPGPLTSNELKELEQQILKDLERARQTSAGFTATLSDSRTTRGDSVDDATNLTERENASLLADRSHALVRDLTDALRRLRSEADAFNICQSCSGRIPFGRLEFLPTTRTCIRCAPRS